jgi:hypothetical protein
MCFIIQDGEILKKNTLGLRKPRRRPQYDPRAEGSDPLMITRVGVKIRRLTVGSQAMNNEPVELCVT